MPRKTLVLLLSALVLPFQALAEGNECAVKGIAGLSGLSPEDITVAEARHQPVYVELGSRPVAGERMTFEVFVDAAPYFKEEVTLAGSPAADEHGSGGTPVVELFAANEARLGHLYRLAQAHQVEVTLYRGATTVESDSFSNLAAKSDELLAVPVLPQAVHSTTTTPVRLRQKDACHDYCDDRQDECYDRCGQFGSASCYNACDNQWVDCLENCGSCQPSTTTTTTLTSVGYTPLNISECLWDPIFGLGEYRIVAETIKKTVTTTTTHADCSQTVSVAVTYMATYCHAFLGSQSCSPVGIANICCCM